MYLANFNKGDKVFYRVRWDMADLRVGTIGKIGDNTIWIGCHCLSHSDVKFMRHA